MDRFRRFDEAYYHRFYESPQTRVVSAEEHHHLAQFVFSFAEYNKVEMKSVLDDSDKKINAVLNDQQKEQYAQIEQQMREQIRERMQEKKAASDAQ